MPRRPTHVNATGFVANSVERAARGLHDGKAGIGRRDGGPRSRAQPRGEITASESLNVLGGVKARNSHARTRPAPPKPYFIGDGAIRPPSVHSPFSPRSKR